MRNRNRPRPIQQGLATGFPLANHEIEEEMSWTFRFVILFYLAGVLFVHATPTGDGVSLSDIDVTGGVRGSDLVHVIVFLPWGLLGLAYVFRRPIGSFGRAVAWVALGCIVAVLAEGAQYWIPYRSFNPSDMMFNLAGVLLGSLILLLGAFFQRKRGREEEWRSAREVSEVRSE